MPSFANPKGGIGFSGSLLAGLEEIDPDQSGRLPGLQHPAPFLATGAMERTLLRP